MTQEQIKSDCEKQYQQIKDAEQALKELRELCSHPNTFEGNWSWRVGSIEPATICSDCGTCVKVHRPTFWEVPTQQY